MIELGEPFRHLMLRGVTTFLGSQNVFCSPCLKILDLFA